MREHAPNTPAPNRGLATIALVAAVAMLILAIVANFADAEPEPRRDVVEVRVEGASPDLVDWTDPATGCTYLVHRLGGVTPRLNAAGRPLCRGVR